MGIVTSHRLVSDSFYGISYTVNGVLRRHRQVRAALRCSEPNNCSLPNHTAFAGYAALLVSNQISDFEKAYKMGRVAVEMTKRLGANEIMPMVYVTVYSIVTVYKVRDKMQQRSIQQCDNQSLISCPASYRY